MKNVMTSAIADFIKNCTHHTTVMLLDREKEKTVIGNVCEIHSMKPIAEIIDDIWHLCNWACWNGTIKYEDTYNEHHNDEYRVSDDGMTYMIPCEFDNGFADHNIIFIDNDDVTDVKFWLAQSIGWVKVDTIAQAFSISTFTTQEEIL